MKTKTNSKSHTWHLMSNLTKQIGTTMFVQDDWHHWFFEAAERYGYKMEIVRFVKGGVWFKIISQDKPDWV